MAHQLLFVEPGEAITLARATHRVGPGPFSMRNARLPVEASATSLAESGDYSAELRVNRTAVVALVVVLENDLPVRRNVVHRAMGNAQIAEWVAHNSFTDWAEGLHQATAWCSRTFSIEFDKDKPTPGRGCCGVEAKVRLFEPWQLLKEGCGAQGAIELVGPRVVRATEDALRLARCAVLCRCERCAGRRVGA